MPTLAGLSAICRRYLTIYVTLWRNSIAREMGYKSNFILWIITEFLWFALQLTFMSVIYLHTDRIGTWSKWEVIFLVGASHFIQQIFQAFFLTNCTQMGEMVRTGKMDFMFLLPVNTRFLLSLRQVDLGGFFNAGTAVAVMGYAGQRLEVSWSLGPFVGFCLLTLVGISIHYSILFMLAAISFWTVKSQGIVWGYYSMFNIARMPDSAFHGPFRAVFTFLIPVLLVSNVPVKVVLEKLHHPWELAWLMGAAVLTFLLSQMVWRASMRRYTSASS